MYVCVYERVFIFICMYCQLKQNFMTKRETEKQSCGEKCTDSIRLRDKAPLATAEHLWAHTFLTSVYVQRRGNRAAHKTEVWTLSRPALGLFLGFGWSVSAKSPRLHFPCVVKVLRRDVSGSVRTVLFHGVISCRLDSSLESSAPEMFSTPSCFLLYLNRQVRVSPSTSARVDFHTHQRWQSLQHSSAHLSLILLTFLGRPPESPPLLSVCAGAGLRCLLVWSGSKGCPCLSAWLSPCSFSFYQKVSNFAMAVKSRAEYRSAWAVWWKQWCVWASAVRVKIAALRVGASWFFSLSECSDDLASLSLQDFFYGAGGGFVRPLFYRGMRALTNRKAHRSHRCKSSGTLHSTTLWPTYLFDNFSKCFFKGT